MPDKENLSKKPIVEAEHGAIEAEEGVLACIMLEPEGALLDTVVAMGLDVDDFSTSANQEMFRAMQQLRNDKKPIDEIVLLEALTKAGEADRIGGLDGIFKIQKRVETSTHIKYLAEIVLSRSQSRKLRRALREGCEELASGSPADQVSSKIEQHIKTSLAQVGEDETVAKASQDIEDDLKAMMNGTYECRGVPTRIKAIDDMMGAEGMAPGSVTIISAATSCGKSALALNMALRHAIETKEAVGIFSYEMPNRQLANRMVQTRSGVNLQKFKEGVASERDQQKVADAIRGMKEIDIYTNHTHNTIDKLKAMARQWKRKHDVSLLFVDYLQLMAWSLPNASEKANIDNNSRNLKALALELDIPIVVLAQIGYSARRRIIEHPEGGLYESDLMGSSNISNDADNVLMFWAENGEADKSREIDELGRPYMALKASFVKQRESVRDKRFDLRFRETSGRFE